jgi:hypothetical protein
VVSRPFLLDVSPRQDVFNINCMQCKNGIELLKEKYIAAGSFQPLEASVQEKELSHKLPS